MSLSKLDFIRGAAKALSRARAVLSARVSRLKAVIETANRKHLPGIREAVGSVADCHANLKATLTAAPDLFKEPRSITEAGIKCGYQAHEASIELPKKAKDKEALVLAIKQVFSPAEIKTLGLIRTVEVPVAEKLLAHCTERQFERLGLAYTPAGDHILIKPADSAVDKIVGQLLKAADDEEEEQATSSSA